MLKRLRSSFKGKRSGSESITDPKEGENGGYTRNKSASGVRGSDAPGQYPQNGKELGISDEARAAAAQLSQVLDWIRNAGYTEWQNPTLVSLCIHCRILFRTFGEHSHCVRLGPHSTLKKKVYYFLFCLICSCSVFIFVWEFLCHISDCFHEHCFVRDRLRYWYNVTQVRQAISNRAMGRRASVSNFLPAPITTINANEGTGNGLVWAEACMQGWRWCSGQQTPVIFS